MAAGLTALTLKGGRDYLRGADLYKEALAIAGRPAGRCRAIFHKMTHRRLLTSRKPLVPTLQQKPPRCVAEAHFETISVWFAETDYETTAIEPFDEDGLTYWTLYAGREAYTSETEAATIDLIVAMTKQLHYRLAPTDRKWILTRLDLLNRLPDRPNDVRVSLATEIKPKLTRSTITIGTADFGSIYFSLL